MPLIMRNIPEPKPEVLFEFWWTSGGLSELDGVGIIKGERYLLKLGRKSVMSYDSAGESDYTTLEIQQPTHSADQVEPLELYGDGYTYDMIPLPEPLRSLEGDVIPLGEAGDVRLEVGNVAPWVWPDAEGNYPDNSYTMRALTATMTTAQGDALFATMGIESWDAVLEEQRRR